MLVTKIAEQSLRPKRIASLALPMATLGGPVTAGVMQLLKGVSSPIVGVDNAISIVLSVVFFSSTVATLALKGSMIFKFIAKFQYSMEVNMSTIISLICVVVGIALLGRTGVFPAQQESEI